MFQILNINKMKRIFFIALALFINANLLFAQNSKVAAKPVQNAQTKPVSVKMAVPPANEKKQEVKAQAPANAPHKEEAIKPKPAPATANSAPQQGKPVLKKDGTPDKRFKQNQKLKKDGTPDKRYKENKATTGAK
jgi:hypothetical protein